MIEPLFLRWRQLARALLAPGRSHGREPYAPTDSQRPESGGQPGGAPLGADDEAGSPDPPRR